MNLINSQILLIGVGNEFRSDDGVGFVIARKLKTKCLPNTEVIEESGDGGVLMETWKGTNRVILFDAMLAGVAPGTIYRFEAHTQPISTKFFHCSTHAFGVAEAIELARILHQLPSYFIVYGIEGKTFEAGTGLSPEVEKAAQDVAERVAQEVQYRQNLQDL